MWCFHYCSPCCDNLFASSRSGFAVIPGTSQRARQEGYNDRTNYNVRRISSFERSGSEETESGISSVAPDNSPRFVHEQDKVMLAATMLPPQDACNTTIHMVQPMSQDCRFDSSEENMVDAADAPASAAETQAADTRNQSRLNLQLDMQRAGTVPDIPSVTSSRSPSPERLPWLKAQSTLSLHKISSKLSKFSASTLGLNTALYDARTASNSKGQRSPSPPDPVRNYTSATLHPDGAGSKQNPLVEQHELPKSITPTERAPDLAFGTVFFSTAVDLKHKKFTVHLERVVDFPPKGEQVKYNVIVKLTVLPSEKQTKKSRLVKQSNHNFSTEFNESFTFNIKDMKGKTLRISLFDAERQGENDAVGHALMPIEQVVTEKLERFHMKFYKKSQPVENPGLMQISLSYLSSVSRLTVVILQAQKLAASQTTFIAPKLEKYDTYVKVTLICGGHKVKSKKTPVIANNKNPSYNQAFNFLVPQSFLDDSYIVVKTMLRGILKRDIPIGKVILGPFFYSQGHALTTWGRAIKSKEVLTQWHGLYL